MNNHIETVHFAEFMLFALSHADSTSILNANIYQDMNDTKSTINFLFSLPILIMRFIVKGRIVHEQQIYVNHNVPTTKHRRPIEKT